jgi:hypothetical protein
VHGISINGSAVQPADSSWFIPIRDDKAELSSMAILVESGNPDTF